VITLMTTRTITHMVTAKIKLTRILTTILMPNVTTTPMVFLMSIYMMIAMTIPTVVAKTNPMSTVTTTHMHTLSTTQKKHAMIIHIKFAMIHHMEILMVTLMVKHKILVKNMTMAVRTMPVTTMVMATHTGMDIPMKF